MPLQLIRFPVAQCRDEVSFEDGFLYLRKGGLHHGIDISGPLGTSILAPVSGTVVVRCRLGGERRDGVGNSPKGGNYAVIAAEDGHFHYFAHMQATHIQPGSHISAGSSIGYLGDSGNAAGRPRLPVEVAFLEVAPRHQGMPGHQDLGRRGHRRPAAGDGAAVVGVDGGEAGGDQDRDDQKGGAQG